MVGYLYQVRLGLLWAIRRSRTSDFTVSIETLDDVSFEVGGKPDAVLQTKHSLNAAATDCLGVVCIRSASAGDSRA